MNPLPDKLPRSTEQSPVFLHIPAVVAETVVMHCLQERPREACGWLVGPSGQVGSAWGDASFCQLPVRATRACPMRNVAADPVHRYVMDPAEQFAVLRRLRERGEEVVGIYHSHPTSSAEPSQTDIDLAYMKNVVYAIISLVSTPPTWRGFLLDCDAASAQEVVLHVERNR